MKQYGTLSFKVAACTCTKDLFKKYITIIFFKGEKSRMITFLIFAMTVSIRYQNI